MRGQGQSVVTCSWPRVRSVVLKLDVLLWLLFAVVVVVLLQVLVPHLCLWHAILVF